MSKDARFWRNVTLIGLAHVAVVLGLIRWSFAARTSSNAQSIVWLSGTGDLAVGEPDSGASLREANVITPPPEPSPLKTDEAEREKPPLAEAKSEIELPTPKPTLAATPKAKETPKPTTAKPARKKTVVAKASPKPSPKVKPTLTKSREKAEQADANADKKKIPKGASVKNVSAPQTGSKTTSASARGRAGSGGGASEFGWYGNMLHDRFNSAWIQPTTSVTSGTKISTLVNVRIEKDGRVSNFEIIKPSENVVVNESVAAIAKRVTQVDPLPAGLGNGDHYDVKINFELSPEQAMAR
jgi:outer membrane biosynthesis protein TonB